MLSKLLDGESQTKIKDTISDVTFPLRIYSIIVVVILLLNAFYLYLISRKLGNL